MTGLCRPYEAQWVLKKSVTIECIIDFITLHDDSFFLTDSELDFQALWFELHHIFGVTVQVVVFHGDDVTLRIDHIFTLTVPHPQGISRVTSTYI